MMDPPENYSPEYQNRMYYANWCNLCFSSENLLKCASCLAVSYCSKQHQMEDWSFHKPTCIALKEIKSEFPFPKKCDFMEFYLYTKVLMECLVKYRRLPDSSYLTTYERQICLLPWVCSVCYRKPSSNFECRLCNSVTYCSLQHKEKDYVDHANFCMKLRICRYVASFGYGSDFKSHFKQYTYQKIKQGYKQWPSTKFELFRLIQNLNERQIDLTEEYLISAILFMEPYIPAATILNALEKAGFVKKRRFISKSSELKWNNGKKQRKSHRKYGPSKTKSTLVIHFAISDAYELSFHWVEIAQLLSDWLINVDEVEIVLTGQKLDLCVIPSYETRDKLAGVFIHKMAHEKAQCITIPDVIVMFECQRSLNINAGQFWNDDNIEGLFRNCEVPVIVASGDYNGFQRTCSILTSCINVEMLIGTSYNFFVEMYEDREWQHNIRTYNKNFFFSVFTKHQY